MATFLAYRIMSGKLTFTEVPVKLKEQVRKILEEEGCGDLAE